MPSLPAVIRAGGLATPLTSSQRVVHDPLLMVNRINQGQPSRRSNSIDGLSGALRQPATMSSEWASRPRQEGPSSTSARTLASSVPGASDHPGAMERREWDECKPLYFSQRQLAAGLFRRCLRSSPLRVVPRRHRSKPRQWRHQSPAPAQLRPRPRL